MNTVNQAYFRVLVPENVDTMYHLMGLVQQFRPTLLRRAERHMDAFLAARVDSGLYDASTAYDYWVDRRIAVSAQGFDDPEVDTAFSLSFAPLNASYQRGQRIVLGIAHCTQSEWLRGWLRTPTVEEYAYWGVKARPSRLRAEAWEARRREWEDTMNPDMATSTQALCIEVLGPYEPFPKGLRGAAVRDRPASIA